MAPLRLRVPLVFAATVAAIAGGAAFEARLTGAHAADESGMHQFLMQEGLKRQGSFHIEELLGNEDGWQFEQNGKLFD